jgi:hypothetical protein
MLLKNINFFAIKNFDKDKSLYFFSNSASGKNSVTNLDKTYSTINCLKKKISGYQQLLNKYKQQYEILESEVNK